MRQSAKAPPVVRNRATAVRNQKLQRREVFEQITRQALHECCRVGIQIMRASGVEAGVATGTDVNHGRNVVLHHLLVDRVPVLVGKWWRCPMTTRWVGVQVDADVAVLLHTFDQFRNAGFRVNAWALRQHGHGYKVVREKLADAVAQLVANGRPGRRHIEVANVVRHEAGARAEDGQVTATLFHQTQLICFNRLAQLVVADFQIADLWHDSRVFDASDLLVAPDFQRLGGGGVVAMAVDDEGFLKAHVGSRCYECLSGLHAVFLFDGIRFSCCHESK